MRIGIIGAGNVGGVLVRKFRDLGYSVRVANSRGPETLNDLETETGATASTVAEVIQNSDVIFIAVNQSAIRSLPRELFVQLPASAVVVDCGSYFHQRDGRIKEIDEGLPDSVWVSQQLGVPVLKAFNNIGFAVLHKKGLPAGHPDRIALSVFGDSVEAKNTVLGLIDKLGFDGLDGGVLAESWRQQPGTAAFCTDYNLNTLRDVLANVVRSEIPIRIDVFASKVYQRDLAAYTLEETAAWIRAHYNEPFEKIQAEFDLLPKS